MWVYLIERKSKVLIEFKRFKLHVEKHNECTIKKLRTNGGGEYTLVEFAKFCNDESIEHEIIAPYTSQHNGIAERKNKSILNMSGSMLKAKGMPTTFWGEATSIAVYILNICPTKKMVKKTPYEAWT